MLSKEQFKKLSQEKRWNYLQLLYSEKNSFFQEITNKLMVVLAFGAIVFAAMQIPVVLNNSLIIYILYIILFCVLGYFSIKVKPLYSHLENYKETIANLNKIYFNSNNKK